MLILVTLTNLCCIKGDVGLLSKCLHTFTKTPEDILHMFKNIGQTHEITYDIIVYILNRFKSKITREYILQIYTTFYGRFNLSDEQLSIITWLAQNPFIREHYIK